MGYYRLLWVERYHHKNIVTHRNLSELIGTHNTHLPQAPQPNFLSEGVRLGLDKEKLFLIRIMHAPSQARDRIYCQNNARTFPKRETEFLVRRGQMQRSAKKMRMGCTLAYCPFAFIFDSGNRCAPYHKKFNYLRFI